MIKVPYARIEPYASIAAKDRVSVGNTQNTEWFIWFDQVKEPPFCALMKTTKGYRIKGVWVPAKLRGNGVGKEMTLALMNYAANDLMASRIEVFAYNPKFYEIHGYKRFGKLPNGAIKLEKLL